MADSKPALEKQALCEATSETLGERWFRLVLGFEAGFVALMVWLP